jgi:RimJ/RimL family protein N-acetyltransferase
MEQLVFNQLSSSDISSTYLDTLNDPEHMRFSKNSKLTHTHESQLQYLNSFDGVLRQIFATRLASTNQFIGVVNAFANLEERFVDLGFLVFKEFSGHGFGKLMVQEFMKFMQFEYPQFTIRIGTAKNNTRMLRAINETNYHFVGSDKKNNYYEMPPNSFVGDLDVVRIPNLLTNARKVLVVANDAGGAKQILEIAPLLNGDVQYHLEGPAVEIFRSTPTQSMKSLISDFDLILTSTGWMSNLERSAIAAGKRLKIPVFTVLDHWSNYTERFDNNVGYPDFIGVTNSLAFSLTKNIFSASIIYQLPDLELNRFRAIIDSATLKNQIYTLVILEPIERPEGEFKITLELLLDMILNAIDFHGVESGVLIRFHPSQTCDSEEVLRIKEVFPHVQISENSELVDDLLISKAVFGASSYALYLSAMLGFETYSCFQGYGVHWCSHFPQISKSRGHV